jgi:hypothetical protein
MLKCFKFTNYFYIMKINTLDLAKNISDFLFLWVENPEEKARKLFEIKHSLTAHWFEKYMQYYFQNKKSYKVALNWRTNDFDQWIDLKWVKYENWENYFLIVQCKKFSVKDITEDLIAHFYWKVIDKVIDKKEKTELYYITTSKFTEKAKIFWGEKGIKLVDFYDIYKLQDFYSLEQFKEDLYKIEWIKEYEKSIEDNTSLLNLYDDYFNIIKPSNSELYQFLKQVRRDYSYINNLRLWDIAKNETLELLARERPHNLQSLKNVIIDLPTREKNKILKHGNVFIDRLKYLYIEEVVKDIKVVEEVKDIKVVEEVNVKKETSLFTDLINTIFR